MLIKGFHADDLFVAWNKNIAGICAGEITKLEFRYDNNQMRNHVVWDCDFEIPQIPAWVRDERITTSPDALKILLQLGREAWVMFKHYPPEMIIDAIRAQFTLIEKMGILLGNRIPDDVEEIDSFLYFYKFIARELADSTFTGVTDIVRTWVNLCVYQKKYNAEILNAMLQEAEANVCADIAQTFTVRLSCINLREWLFKATLGDINVPKSRTELMSAFNAALSHWGLPHADVLEVTKRIIGECRYLKCTSVDDVQFLSSVEWGTSLFAVQYPHMPDQKKFDRAIDRMRSMLKVWGRIPKIAYGAGHCTTVWCLTEDDLRAINVGQMLRVKKVLEKRELYRQEFRSDPEFLLLAAMFGNALETTVAKIIDYERIDMRIWHGMKRYIHHTMHFRHARELFERFRNVLNVRDVVRILEDVVYLMDAEDMDSVRELIESIHEYIEQEEGKGICDREILRAVVEKIQITAEDLREWNRLDNDDGDDTESHPRYSIDDVKHALDGKIEFCPLMQKIASVATPGVRVLPKTDPLGLELGRLTDCCQSLGKAGATCVVAGYTLPESGFLVFEKEGGIVAQAWIYVVENTLILDNIEAPTGVSTGKIRPTLKWFIRSMLNEVPEIREIHLGTRYGSYKVTNLPDVPVESVIFPQSFYKENQMWVYTDAYNGHRVYLAHDGVCLI